MTAEDLKNMLPGSGYYEFKDAQSNKYWRVEPVKPHDPFGDYKVTWGKIGGRGQSQQVPRATAARRIREKVSKGYLMVTNFATHARAQEDLDKHDLVQERREARATATKFLEELFKIT